MIILLLGAPGSGKGTQAKKIVSRFNIPQLSTGDILRNAIDQGTATGLLAKGVMDKGGLVSDEIMISIVEERIQNEDCANGFVLDGFPRTLVQADSLHVLLESKGLNIAHVLNFVIDEDKLINRLSGRRISESGGHEYHLEYKKPQVNGICDITGSKLIQREDDKPENIKKRLEVFSKSTLPLVDYYDQRGTLRNIDADRDMLSVEKSILELLK